MTITETTSNSNLRTKAALAAAVVLAASTLMLAPAKPAQAAFPGENGRIAFTSNQEGNNFEIYTITQTVQIRRGSPSTRRKISIPLFPLMESRSPS
jgi:hypothetical protein